MNSKTTKITVKEGDKIKTVYGDWFTVCEVRDNVIYTGDVSGTVHISKVVRVISK